MEERPLEPYYWKACAGIPARPPAAGAVVYYFPDGHSEQTSSTPELSGFRLRDPFVFQCSVSSVRLLADGDNDEVYAVIRLDPSPSTFPAVDSDPVEELGVAGPGVKWHAKVLTPSDANNGGGFSIPRHAAEDLLPPLNYKEDPIMQKLRMRDAHGKVWEFRHIYRGTPRRHLLTTGWAPFVNAKMLVAGDSIVFVRNAEGELFVGVRRAVGRKLRKRKHSSYSRSAEAEVADDGGFSRRWKGRVSPDAVVEAAVEAEGGRPFEVVYYPRAGPEFVVERAMVDEALGVHWVPGMRVKAPVELEDSTKVGWHQGTVVGTKTPERGPWRCSIWRMLQVKWDEPAYFPPTVNPWQVEIVTESLQVPNTITAGRTRLGNAELSQINQSIPFIASRRVSSPISGNVNRSSLVCSPFPAGMQGARQDITGISSLSSFRPYNVQWTNTENAAKKVARSKVDHVSTGLSIWSPSASETPSPPSGDTVLCSVTTTYSFRLFGRTIQTEVAVKTDADLNDIQRGATTDSPAVPIPRQEYQQSDFQDRDV